MALQPHQARVVAEKDELDVKIDKLITFIDGAVFLSLPREEQDRLERQLDIMREYSKVLGERIGAFV